MDRAMTFHGIDRLVALVAAIVCFSVAVAGWGMRGDAGVFPMIVGGLGLLACAWLALTSRRVEGASQRPAPSDRQRLGLWCLGLVALLVLIEPVGTFIVLPLFLIFNLKLLARLSWRTTLLLAGGFTLGIYLVFARLLAVPLPAGWLAI